MSFRIDKFNAGRGQFNRRAQPLVIATHYYEAEPDSPDTAKANGFFDEASEFLINGDMIWISNPSANPVLVSVNQATVPVEVQEVQVPRISAVIPTVGGGVTESFLADIPSDYIPFVQVNTSAVANLTAEKAGIVGGKVEVTFSADPLTSTISIMLIAPILPAG